MLSKFIDAGLNGFILKFGLWMGGYMTDTELLEQLGLVGSDKESNHDVYLRLAGAPHVAGLRNKMKKLSGKADSKK